MTAAPSMPGWPRPRLIAITDCTVVRPSDLADRLEPWLAAARPGSVMVQLRDHQLPIRERLDLGRQLSALARRHEQLLCVNDRLDLALCLGADGLHLGERSLPPRDARGLWGGHWISRACHEPAGATPAGADAIVLSPVLAPRKGRPALGVDAVRHARQRAASAWLVALGGIGADGARRCLEAGADGVAAIGAVLHERDPSSLLDALGVLRAVE